MQPVNGETNEVEAGRRLKPIRVPCVSWTTSPSAHTGPSRAERMTLILRPMNKHARLMGWGNLELRGAFLDGGGLVRASTLPGHTALLASL
jgi:hypothetical protein